MIDHDAILQLSAGRRNFPEDPVSLHLDRAISGETGEAVGGRSKIEGQQPGFALLDADAGEGNTLLGLKVCVIADVVLQLHTAHRRHGAGTHQEYGDRAGKCSVE